MRKRRVAIYVRVSTNEQAKEGYSIQEQIKRLKKYCEAMGWIIVKIYIDAGESGGSMDRKGLQDMIEEIDTFDTVLVYKLDRLSRSQKDTLFLIEDVFLANEVDFVSVTEAFDTSTPFGRAMVGILAVFAQLERENIKERMGIGKQARAELGKFHGSKWVPIGYDYIKENDKLEVNEYEKMQIHKIYDMFLSGKTVNAIMKQMNSDGYKHKHGKWSHKTIRRILESKTYLGYLKYHNVWYKGEHTAIIAQEEYERVQARLALLKDHDNHTNKGSAALSNLCVCGHCGSKYARRGSHKNPETGKYKYYYICYSRAKTSPSMIKDPNCKNKNYRKEDLEKMVFDEVKKLAFDPEAIKNIQKEHDDKDHTENIILIKNQIEELNKRLANMVDLFSIGKMDMSIVEAKTSEIQNEKSRLERKLKQLQSATKPSVAETQELAQSLVNIIDEGDDDHIRTILQQLINDITIDGDDITIHWRFA